MNCYFGESMIYKHFALVHLVLKVNYETVNLRFPVWRENLFWARDSVILNKLFAILFDLHLFEIVSILKESFIALFDNYNKAIDLIYQFEKLHLISDSFDIIDQKNIEDVSTK